MITIDLRFHIVLFYTPRFFDGYLSILHLSLRRVDGAALRLWSGDFTTRLAREPSFRAHAKTLFPLTL